MIPALDVHIGQLGLGSNDLHLGPTQERFRVQLNELRSWHGKQYWRDNPARMKLLAEWCVRPKKSSDDGYATA
jgi:hypothetical protein